MFRYGHARGLRAAFAGNLTHKGSDFPLTKPTLLIKDYLIRCIGGDGRKGGLV